jgi:hypothetical protein
MDSLTEIQNERSVHFKHKINFANAIKKLDEMETGILRLKAGS